MCAHAWAQTQWGDLINLVTHREGSCFCDLYCCTVLFTSTDGITGCFQAASLLGSSVLHCAWSLVQEPTRSWPFTWNPSPCLCCICCFWIDVPCFWVSCVRRWQAHSRAQCNPTLGQSGCSGSFRHLEARAQSYRVGVSSIAPMIQMIAKINNCDCSSVRQGNSHGKVE